MSVALTTSLVKDSDSDHLDVVGLLLKLGQHGDLGAAMGELDGIGEEIEQNLL